MRRLLVAAGGFAAGAVAVLVVLVAAYAIVLRDRAALEPWHLAQLDAEFTAADAARVQSLANYLALEEALFRQLDDQVYARVPAAADGVVNRYAGGGRADPRGRRPDWNHTIELRAPQPVGGVLLLHGASDSPYSMRALAERFRERGFEVLALRLLGHGTAPAGLVSARWQDGAAAARLGARHVAGRLPPGRPFYIAGYSTGGALAVEYELARLGGEDLPAPAGLVLVSPAIGVSPAAALAVWQSRLAALPGLESLAWNDLLPEYDPYKYGSFAVNAGDQVYRLTQRVGAQLSARAGTDGRVHGLPPILAFQSVADATVSTPALVHALFERLAPEGHELVLFDVDRHGVASQFLAPGMRAVRRDLLEGPPLAFDLTVLGTQAGEAEAITAFRRAAGGTAVASAATGLRWPPATFSLSHVALPFPPDDPLYGARRPEAPGALYLGRIEAQGERGVITIPAGALLRLRHNPFFGYLAERVDAFTTASAP